MVQLVRSIEAKRRVAPGAIQTQLPHWVFAALFLFTPLFVQAQDYKVEEAQQLLSAGEYRAAAEYSGKAIASGLWNDAWRTIKLQAELDGGDYVAAFDTADEALRRFTTNLRVRWLAAIAFRNVGENERAEAALKEIETYARQRPWRYTDPESRVTLGWYFLRQGADARQVLELFYDVVKKSHPKDSQAFVASGELALTKHDYGVAASEFQRALKISPEDAAAHFGVALALADSEPEKASEALDKTLKLNPNHTRALLYLAERAIDGERYDDAVEALDKIHAYNAEQEDAWALRSVIAHLNADEAKEKFYRTLALGWWEKNPAIDHLIGRKLSQKYRFVEGAARQRKALEFDGEFTDAKIQLSQDLLRLGQEDEGWKLAKEVNESDGYNIVAHNLVTLHDHISKFRTLEADGLLLRMDVHEAAIYGEHVLELLSQAREELVKKYKVELQEPVLIEIFPEQQDFAIRTFGLPGGAGFLGVCFGSVITANSPASQGENPSNWKAVLWHEYCHVVTLQKTANKMPRWLSEGISVYEERQANATWGQSMTPRYRDMILGGELTPVSQLSSAFLRPKSALHLQFAYYESSLAVEFLVDQHGAETLFRVLDDLRVGMPINDSLSRYVGSLEEFDTEFAAWTKKRAEEFFAETNWSQDDVPETTDIGELQTWLEKNANSYWGQLKLAVLLLNERRWEAAKQPLEAMRKLYPDDTSNPNVYRMLAQVHHELKDEQQEQLQLEALAERSADAIDAHLRLMELAEARADWAEVLKQGQRLTAINPLLPSGRRLTARAAEETGDLSEAARSYRALLTMDPLDPAEAHFRFARVLVKLKRLPEARRQVLMALEEAPRYRAAHRLLLEILKSPELKTAVAAPTEENAASAAGQSTAAPPASPTPAADDKPPAPPSDDQSQPPPAKKRVPAGAAKDES
ncbi:MAG: tetratricopeptide repeat protein [Pirellulaceae bacterium]|nr:tetratricopeptide repeat protein [Pirellulaceae bacterium]